MANKYPAFRSFQAGEITPRLHARADTAIYQHALTKCENFNITPQGSAIMRRGWHYIDNAINNTYIRLLTFNRSLDEDIVLELSEGNIRAFNSKGGIIVDLGDTPGAPNTQEYELVNDGDFNSGLTWWDVTHYNNTGGEDVRKPKVRGGWYISNTYDSTGSQTRQYDLIRQTLTKPQTNAINDEVLITFATKFDPEEFPPRFGIPANVPTLLWDATIYELDGTTIIQTLVNQTGVGQQAFPLINMTLREGVIIELRAHHNAGGSVTFYGAQFTGISAKYTVELPSPAPGSYPWTEEQIPFIQTQMLTGQETMILVHKDVPPYLLTFDADTYRFRLSEALLTGVPAWDATTGWPGTVEIFQGRLWMASNHAGPSDIWASQSGDFFNFDLGTGLANEGLYLPLATRGVIRWLLGQSKTMAIGTDLGEHIINSVGPIVTPSDGAATPVSSYGTSPIQAIPYGNQIMYVTTDVRKLLSINYEDRVQNWEATDLTWIAEHLTESYVLDFHAMRAPDYQVVAITQDGNWIQCTYDNVLGVLGWHKHDCLGDIKSITVTRSSVGDVLWASIEREGKLTINRLDASLTRRIHLDFWARRFPKEDLEGWYIDEIHHLAGQTIRILLDDAIHTDQVVAQDGTVRLDRAGIEAYVGLPYKGTLTTLPEEPADGNESYSGGKKRNARVTVRLVNSAMPLINGKRPADRSPQTPMNTRDPNVTTDINVKSLGWDDQGLITIVQDKPLRTEIVGIFTKLGVNKT